MLHINRLASVTLHIQVGTIDNTDKICFTFQMPLTIVVIQLVRKLHHGVTLLIQRRNGKSVRSVHVINGVSRKPHSVYNSFIKWHVNKRSHSSFFAFYSHSTPVGTGPLKQHLFNIVCLFTLYKCCRWLTCIRLYKHCLNLVVKVKFWEAKYSGMFKQCCQTIKYTFSSIMFKQYKKGSTNTRKK